MTTLLTNAAVVAAPADAVLPLIVGHVVVQNQLGRRSENPKKSLGSFVSVG